MNRILYACCLITFLSFGTRVGFAQDAKALLQKVEAQHARVQDFKADVEIKVNVDYLRVPVKRARLLYKRPDKLTFKAKGFLMIPRKGVRFSVEEFLGEQVTALYLGLEEIAGISTHKIKVIPLYDGADWILATLWLEERKDRVRRIEAHTAEAGAYRVDFVYGDAPFDLPVETQISFELGKMQLPLKYIGNLEVDTEELPDQAQGEVRLLYGNFKVNEGIPDELFDEPSEP